MLAARRNVDIMNEALIAARRMRELLDSRVTEGETPKLDANIAAVEAGRIEADLAIAQAEADAAAIELKALAGLPFEQSAGTCATPSRRSCARTRRTRRTRRPQPRRPSRPALTSARRPRASRSPTPESKKPAARERPTCLSWGTTVAEGYGFNQRGFDSAGRLVADSRQVSQLHDWREPHAATAKSKPGRTRGQRKLSVAVNRKMLAARQLSAQAELDAAVVRDREALRAVELYAGSIRDLARQNVEVQLEAYDLGRTPLTELLAEQRRYLDVEAGYTSALARAYDAAVTLRRARGETR